MNINDYQLGALETAIYPKDKKVIYPALGLPERLEKPPTK